MYNDDNISPETFSDDNTKKPPHLLGGLGRGFSKRKPKSISNMANDLFKRFVKALNISSISISVSFVVLCTIGISVVFLSAFGVIGIIDLDGQNSSNGTNTYYDSNNACIDGLVYDNPNAPVYKEFGNSATKIRDTIRPYLQKKGYEQYIDIIVALSAQESGCGTGSGKDNWMQVQGYNGTSGIDSMYVGIDHFINLIKTYCIPQKCTDINILIQSYNFGCGYISYCMQNGGKETRKLREQFQKEHDSGSGYGDIDYVDKALRRVKGQKPSDAGYAGKLFSDDEQLQKLLEKVEEQIGKPYVWGATGPDTFDCSGLIKYCCNSVGIKNIPRTSLQQYNYCQTFTDEKDAKPGDLVFFAYEHGKGTVHHVGIYVGNGQYIHAPSTGKTVEYAKLSSRSDRKAFGRIPKED